LEDLTVNSSPPIKTIRRESTVERQTCVVARKELRIARPSHFMRRVRRASWGEFAMVGVTRRTAAVIAGAAAMLTAVQAFAKPPAADPGRAAVVQALSDCRKIADNPDRLACYDKAAGAFDQAETQGQVVVIDREQVTAVRRQAFGFMLPSLNIFDRGAKTDKALDHLDLNLEGAHHSSEGRWVFVSTDGAVWRQTDDAELSIDPHKGSKLLVKNGLLGSFFCKVDGQPQVRCQRVS
jgi:hypothetical protein